jgi:pimeloyl-ACP methyl ester carboxylesterase
MIEALSGAYKSGGVNFLTYQATLCYDDGTFASRAEFDAVSSRYPAPLTGLGYDLVCDDWPAASATLDEIEPVRSAIPTLILHCEYDHQTPPTFGQELSRVLTNSYLHIFPGTSTMSVSPTTAPRE